jgi:cell division protein FtsB
MMIAVPRRHVVKAPLTWARHVGSMVIRTRIRSALGALGLYVGAALLIGYFWAHAHSGEHGLEAKQDLIQQEADLSRDLALVKAEREAWEHRVALLRPNAVDPDLLEERARAQLQYTHPRDLTLMLKRR